MRPDKRKSDDLRPVRITRRFIKHAEGSVLIEMGETKVICTATLEDRVPPFLRNQGKGWITAEYGMLPRATQERKTRESATGRIGGRTQEIQRLIGRSLRAVVDRVALGERTVWIDCDVIQADGGTRTASITGAFIALADALSAARENGMIKNIPLTDHLAAVSVGKVNGKVLLDLTYAEDSSAEVDFNMVMTGGGKLVEIQGTAEGAPFTARELSSFVALARKGIGKLIALEKELLGPL